jgi:hypothetical protein
LTLMGVILDEYYFASFMISFNGLVLNGYTFTYAFYDPPQHMHYNIELYRGSLVLNKRHSELHHSDSLCGSIPSTTYDLRRLPL